MVVISVSVISKVGKPLVARQYRDISRVRLEGLLSAFPKLMDPKSQHTFVETDSVRYVYQSLDQLFLVLITTKTSNIVEDLETLQLFSRIVRYYCDCLYSSEMYFSNNNFYYHHQSIHKLFTTNNTMIRIYSTC